MIGNIILYSMIGIQILLDWYFFINIIRQNRWIIVLNRNDSILDDNIKSLRKAWLWERDKNRLFSRAVTNRLTAEEKEEWKEREANSVKVDDRTWDSITVHPSAIDEEYFEELLKCKKESKDDR